MLVGMATNVMAVFDYAVGNTCILLRTSSQHKKRGFRVMTPQKAKDRRGRRVTRTVIICQNKYTIPGNALAQGVDAVVPPSRR